MRFVDMIAVNTIGMNFSALNGHRFRHNFERSNPICVWGRIEDNKNFILLSMDRT